MFYLIMYYKLLFDIPLNVVLWFIHGARGRCYLVTYSPVAASEVKGCHGDSATCSVVVLWWLAFKEVSLESLVSFLFFLDKWSASCF